MKEHIREDPRIVAAAERQMHAWSLTQRIADEAAQTANLDQPTRGLGEFITLSREAGSGAADIAARVGQILGWEVLDKNLVDRVAERFNMSKPMLELLDETKSNWVHDVLGAWMDRRVIPHEKYLIRLVHIIVTAARRGNVVIVGRGAQFYLPRDQGMAVRIIASEKYRVQGLMVEDGLTETRARQYMGELDRGRREFTTRYFHRDITDPHNYDLVVHADRLGPQGTAELIAESYQRFFSHKAREARRVETVGASP